MAELAVDIQGLTKVYGTTRAVDDVTLAIEPGEIVALLGPNGAGKTTLIGCVAGLIKPTAGTIRVHGHDALKDHRAARRAVGLVPQEINFDPFFDVEESLRFQAGYFGVDLTEARLVELLAALGLADKRTARTRALSGGMKRRLLIGKALVHEPRVLFLDEPTAGVDLELRRDLWRYVRALRERGTTIVLTTHYLEEAEELADRVGLIHRGRLLLVEDKDHLLDRFGERVVRIVLGVPVTAVPAALAALGARIVDGGAALELTMPAAGEVGGAVAAAAEAGLVVRDVESRRTGLEEVYVKIVGAERVA